MKKTIFWDFDGTLVYCHHLWSNSVLQVICETVPEYGATLDDVRPYMASGYPWDPPALYETLAPEEWWPFLYRKFAEVYQAFGISKEKAQQLGPYTRELILDPKKYFLYDDTLMVLAETRSAGWQNVILSNNYPELEQTIAALGLTNFFDGTVISGKIGLNKPQQEIFNYARKLSGNPEQCIMVGDNPNADAKGAHDAGIPSVLVHRKVNSCADYHCDTLTDVLTLLKKL